MKVAVVGGGINGVMSAWALARRGAEVTLFERDELMHATSSASTKLLHGGIRYLETGQFSLVREALRERFWWMEQAPHLAHPLRILIPVLPHSRRGRWMLRLGLALYDVLAGRSLGRTAWLTRAEVESTLPTLKCSQLRGAYAFYDGQMDDRALGQWAADQACLAGVTIRTRTPVARISLHGEVILRDATASHYERVINAAGPWAAKLLSDSGIEADHELDLIRGSHLLVNRQLTAGVLLEVPGTERVAFVLPYQGKTLIGTTEVRQSLEQPIRCSTEERQLLVDLFNAHFDPPLQAGDEVSDFAGVRPLLRSHANPTRATREYALERRDAVISIFGGKWTTSRALGEKVAHLAR